MQDNFEKNIKSQLENHEINAPENAWENISAALAKKNPKAKPWMKRMGFLVALLIPALMMTGLWYFNTDSNQTKTDSKQNVQPMTLETSPSNENAIINNYNMPEKQYLENKNELEDVQDSEYEKVNGMDLAKINKFDSSSTHAISQQTDFTNSSNSTTEFTTNENSYVFNTIKNFKPQDFENPLTKNIKIAFEWNEEKPRPNLYTMNPSMGNLDFDSELDEILQENDTFKEKNKVQLNRNDIIVSPFAGVAFIGSLNEASWISPEFNRLDIENRMATSYGARAAYNLNEKLKIRSGVGVMDLKQTTLDVPLVINAENGSIVYNLRSYNNVGVDLTRYGQVSNFYANTELEGGDKMNENISHELQFIEVPLELEYLLTENQKLNFLVTGGMSTMFLNKNDVYLESQTASFAKSTNMKSVSFSANAGMKMEYGFTEKLSLNVEPQLRYMINTVTANSDFQPYLLIMNAGFSLSF